MYRCLSRERKCQSDDETSSRFTREAGKLDKVPSSNARSNGNLGQTTRASDESGPSGDQGPMSNSTTVAIKSNCMTLLSRRFTIRFSFCLVVYSRGILCRVDLHLDCRRLAGKNTSSSYANFKS